MILVKRNTDSVNLKALDINALNTLAWNVANSIRGSAGVLYLEDFILPLIVYKRLSDVCDDKFAKYAKEFGSDGTTKKTIDHTPILQEDRHSTFKYYIPHEYRWSFIRNHKADGSLGEFVNRAMKEVVKYNPDLLGVLDLWDYCQQQNGERILDDNGLKALIEILSQYPMGLNNRGPSILGQIHEYFLRKFSNTERMRGGEFYTPKEVNYLIARLINPRSGYTIYDPTCGSGGFLIEARRFFERVYPDEINKAPQLYGQNSNPSSYAIAKMNMILNGYEDTHLSLGDALKNPSFLANDGGLMRFDYVVANPPWNQYVYDEIIHGNDPWNRFKYGIPQKFSADWIWAQHILASLNDKGRAAIILDTGAVFRGSGRQSKEKLVRQRFFENDFIEGIILLPENIVYNTTAPGTLILLNKNKSAARRGQVILINASKYVSRNQSKNVLTNEGIEAVVNVYHSWQTRENLSWIVSLKDIRELDYEIDIAAISMNERIERMASRMGLENASSLSTLALEINLTKESEPPGFEEYSNAVYLPKIGQSDAVALRSELKLKHCNYFQLILNPYLANAEYVASFFNTPLGLAIRRQAASGTVIFTISKKRLEKMQIYLPDLKIQLEIIEAISKIRNLTNELYELNQRLWLEPKKIVEIRDDLMIITRDEHREERFIDWVNTLPFPLASILWMYHTSADDHKKYEHLLHFFETLSEFMATIMLSGIRNDKELFRTECKKISEQFIENNLSIERSSFGTWKMIVERLAKYIRTILNKNDEMRYYCQELFLTNDNQLLSLLTSKKLVGTLQEVNSLRNSWTGHGGIVSENAALERHEILKYHLTTVRETFGTVWEQYYLILPNESRYTSGIYEYDVRKLIGDHSKFEIMKLKLEHPLEDGQLYLVSVNEQRALQLIPMVKIIKTKPIQDACFFYNRRVNHGLRFISYHFEAEPEIIRNFNDTDNILRFFL